MKTTRKTIARADLPERAEVDKAGEVGCVWMEGSGMIAFLRNKTNRENAKVRKHQKTKGYFVFVFSYFRGLL